MTFLEFRQLPVEVICTDRLADIDADSAIFVDPEGSHRIAGPPRLLEGVP
jgi:hypothetical protein